MFYRMLRNITVTTILMLLTGVQAQHSVTFSSQSLCVVIGSTVKIPCTFTPHHSRVTERQWYRVQNSEGEPQDLRKDPEYSGRVSVNTWWSDCSVTVSNVRVSDSGVYNFRFKTQSSDWISASSGIQLTVTDLQVNLDPNTVGQRRVKVTCSSTCRLNSFYWYRNDHYIKYTEDASIVLYSTSQYYESSYSCKVYGSEHRSPPVCVFDEKSCWSVTYSTRTICGLISSSVDIHSYFTFPNKYKVMKMLWFIKEQVNVASEDVREDEEYQGRVQYTQSSQNDCSLRITNLRERDAQTYRFRFYTDDPTGKYTGQPGVSLSVTDLKVTVSDSGSGQINLNCITTCTLSNKPTYIWYKNGQRVSECKSASCSVAAVGGAVSYSCAVEGHDSLLSPPVYSPKNTTAVVLSSGDTVEGDSVTLSCSSDANPPVLTYSWFKQSSAADTLLITDQNYSISNISSQHTGLYYCTAHNQLGHHNSTPTHLDVFYPPRNLSVTVVPSVSGDMVTLLCTSDSNPNSSYTWYRKTKEGVILIRNGTRLTLSSREDGIHYCTARNRFGSSNSSEWADTSDAVKYVVSGFAIALVILVIAVILWMRFYGTYSNGRRAPAPAPEPTVRGEENSKNDSSPVYGNVSAMTSDPTQTASPEDQDMVQYSSVFFQPKHTQEVPLYATVQLPKALNQEEEVEYATVNLVRSRADR